MWQHTDHCWRDQDKKGHLSHNYPGFPALFLSHILCGGGELSAGMQEHGGSGGKEYEEVLGMGETGPADDPDKAPRGPLQGGPGSKGNYLA